MTGSITRVAYRYLKAQTANNKLPPALQVYEDRLERVTRFYPDWVITSANAFMKNPYGLEASGDLYDAADGLYQSVVKLDKDALEKAWPSVRREIPKLLELAGDAIEVVSRMHMMVGKPTDLRQLHTILKAIVKNYVQHVRPLVELGSPAAIETR